MAFFKKILLSVLVIGGLFAYMQASVPSFDDNFAKYLTDDTTDQYGRKETVFDVCIDRNVSFMENVRRLFYPNIATPTCAASSGGILWDMIRVVGFGVLIVFLVITGVSFLTNADSPEETKKAGMSIIHILYGSFLFFGATWLLGSNVLNIQYLNGTQGLVDKLQGGPASLFYQILSFFKALAFFVAIVMIVYYGFKLMSAMDQEDKLNIGKKGIVNVLIALVFIKIIDFVFYIAQLPSFAQKASDSILEIAKISGYLLGAGFVFAIFYSGFLLLTGGANEEQIQKAKNILLGIFLGAIVVFLFLLIVYQIFAEFA